MIFRTVRQTVTSSMYWHVNRSTRPHLHLNLGYQLNFDATVEDIACVVNVPEGALGSEGLTEYKPQFEEGMRQATPRFPGGEQTRLCSLRVELTSFRLAPDEPTADFMYLVGRNLAQEILHRDEFARRFQPAWLTSDVVALARGMRAAGHSAGVPILTDALLEAGCDDPLVIEHLRTCTDHGPCCWVAEMVCAQADAR